MYAHGPEYNYYTNVDLLVYFTTLSLLGFVQSPSDMLFHSWVLRLKKINGQMCFETSNYIPQYCTLRHSICVLEYCKLNINFLLSFEYHIIINKICLINLLICYLITIHTNANYTTCELLLKIFKVIILTWITTFKENIIR